MRPERTCRRNKAIPVRAGRLLTSQRKPGEKIVKRFHDLQPSGLHTSITDFLHEDVQVFLADLPWWEERACMVIVSLGKNMSLSAVAVWISAFLRAADVRNSELTVVLLGFDRAALEGLNAALMSCDAGLAEAGYPSDDRPLTWRRRSGPEDHHLLVHIPAERLRDPPLTPLELLQAGVDD